MTSAPYIRRRALGEILDLVRDARDLDSTDLGERMVDVAQRTAWSVFGRRLRLDAHGYYRLGGASW